MPADDRDRDFLLLARLVRTQGRHGELIADILTDFPERFADRVHVTLLSPRADAPVRAATIERHWLHKGRVVLKFAGIDSISDATHFAGWHVAIPRAERVPLEGDTLYIADLIGCHVIDEAAGALDLGAANLGGVDLGPIIDVAPGEGEALDMLVVGHGAEHGRDELLIPFAKAYLVAVDLPQRRLRMRLPAGLTAINAPLTEEERAAQQQNSDEA